MRLLEIKREVGRRLWQAVCLSASGLKNCSLEDTLVSIGGFWKRYDLRLSLIHISLCATCSVEETVSPFMLTMTSPTLIPEDFAGL